MLSSTFSGISSSRARIELASLASRISMLRSLKSTASEVVLSVVSDLLSESVRLKRAAVRAAGENVFAMVIE